ncbi:MAG: hypothetical protein ABW105_18510, partial [Candidatus Thiodiazotropha sp. 6PLUC1]
GGAWPHPTDESIFGEPVGYCFILLGESSFLRSSVRMNRAAVAWMKCNGIRESSAPIIPDSALLHPGYLVVRSW